MSWWGCCSPPRWDSVASDATPPPARWRYGAAGCAGFSACGCSRRERRMPAPPCSWPTTFPGWTSSASPPSAPPTSSPSKRWRAGRCSAGSPGEPGPPSSGAAAKTAPATPRNTWFGDCGEASGRWCFRKGLQPRASRSGGSIHVCSRWRSWHAAPCRPSPCATPAPAAPIPSFHSSTTMNCCRTCGDCWAKPASSRTCTSARFTSRRTRPAMCWRG